MFVKRNDNGDDVDDNDDNDDGDDDIPDKPGHRFVHWCVLACACAFVAVVISANENRSVCALFTQVRLVLVGLCLSSLKAGIVGIVVKSNSHMTLC